MAENPSAVPHLTPGPLLHVRADSVELRQPSTHLDPVDRLLVVKVGTSSLMCESSAEPAFSLSNLGKLVDSVLRMKAMGYKVVLVTSGAVGAGCLAMKMRKKPSDHVAKRAAAAIGQCRLMRVYEDLFAIRESKVAQLLITRTDFSDKLRFLNFKNTLLQLLHMDVVPIINENDSVASSQLKFGDNDTLAAFCAISLQAAWLFLLTDVDFLYTANPRSHPEAEPIPYVGRQGDVYKLVTDDTMGSSWGSGGMRTKIVAAKLSSATGIRTALCHGQFPERILPILESFREIDAFHDDLTKIETSVLREAVEMGVGRGMEVGLVQAPKKLALPYIGTVFAAHDVCQTIPDNRRWILSLPVRGQLFIDSGAAHAVIHDKSSLLAAGIVTAKGDFYEGECVSIYPANADQEREFGRFREHRGRRLTSQKQDSSPVPRPAGEGEVPATTLRFDGISAAEDACPELARCLVNYSSGEILQIRGLRSNQFEQVLGAPGAPEVAHRSNISFVNALHVEMGLP